MRRTSFFIVSLMVFIVLASIAGADENAFDVAKEIAKLEREIIDSKRAQADTWLFWIAGFATLVTFIATFGLAGIAIYGFVSVQAIREIERDAKETHQNIRETDKSFIKIKKDFEQKLEDLKRSEDALAGAEGESENRVYIQHEENSSPTDADEQWMLGHEFEFGVGIDIDYEKSFYWYEKSAKQGNAIGQARLGMAYRWGTGVEQSDRNAQIWLLKSAKQGSPTGQWGLAGFFEFTKEDLVEAWAWYFCSSEHPNGIDVTQEIARIQKNMTNNEIAQAKQRAKELQKEIDISNEQY